MHWRLWVTVRRLYSARDEAKATILLACHEIVLNMRNCDIEGIGDINAVYAS